MTKSQTKTSSPEPCGGPNHFRYSSFFILHYSASHTRPRKNVRASGAVLVYVTV